MKVDRAPVILKKAVTMCKSKTGVLAARLLVLASLRRRMAVAGAISHTIHALVAAAAAADRDQKARVDCHKALALSNIEKKPSIHDGELVDLSDQLTLFHQDDERDGGDHGCLDWTLHPVFNDDDRCYYADEYEVGGDDDDDHGVMVDVFDDDDDGDELSVMDVIRSNREDEGLEFNMDDVIDQAAEMLIKRFRKRMNRSFQ